MDTYWPDFCEICGREIELGDNIVRVNRKHYHLVCYQRIELFEKVFRVERLKIF